MRPDFLTVGHLPKDLTPNGFTLGGAVTYGAIAAKRLGLSPAVVTSVGGDIDVTSALDDVPVHVVPSEQTTTFLNTYVSGRRTQHIQAVAGPIGAADIPLDWRSAPLVMLGPLAQELDVDLVKSFPNSVVVASIQGWLRQWDSDGKVSPCQWPGDELLPYVDAAILSVDDVDGTLMLDGWKSLVPVLIYTRGAEGLDVHSQGRWQHVDAFPVEEVDPTGAGDVFAAAYLVRFSETQDVMLSARFASCAASFCVEKQGTLGIPSRADVEARLAVTIP